VVAWSSSQIAGYSLKVLRRLVSTGCRWQVQ
jgi:hypothetical protein